MPMAYLFSSWLDPGFAPQESISRCDSRKNHVRFGDTDGFNAKKNKLKNSRPWQALYQKGGTLVFPNLIPVLVQGRKYRRPRKDNLGWSTRLEAEVVLGPMRRAVALNKCRSDRKTLEFNGVLQVNAKTIHWVFSLLLKYISLYWTLLFLLFISPIICITWPLVTKHVDTL